jgi:DNA polymerase-1
MADDTKKLFLLDAFALIYRAHFAFGNNQRFNSKGLNTSAILGFTNTLLEVLKKQNPTHIAVVFDTPKPTFRHVEYVEYKANRDEMPDDLRTAIPYIKDLIKAFNIPVIAVDGFEADDVIGTMAKMAEKEGFKTYMMTPDKDYGQLVSENIFMYKPARMGNSAEVMGVDEILNKWDIKRIDQVIDVLGLMGDASDNIPGIPGVGEKTAIKFLKLYDTLEGLLDNADQLKGKIKEKVENNKEQAILSKYLATIKLDVPVNFDSEELKIKEVNKDVLKQMFIDLEFRRIAENMGLGNDVAEGIKKEVDKNAPADLFNQDNTEEAKTTEETTSEITPYKTIENTDHLYLLIDSPAKRAQLIEELSELDEFCFDTETTSLNVYEADLVGISFSFKVGEAYYIPFPESFDEAQILVDEFKELFEDENIKKIGQNIKYDLAVLNRYNIQLKGKLFDTMVAHFLLHPEMRHNMNVLAETYLNYSPVSIEKLIGKKGKNQLTMRTVPIEQIKEYASEDADITFQLKEKFEGMLNKAHEKKLFEEIDLPLIPVLADMEAEGITLNKESLFTLSAALEKDIINIDTEIQDLAGMTFNISSPKQVGQVLFEVLKIVEKPKKTKTGQYATGEEVLVKLVKKHDIVGKILDYRELVKLKNTYVDSLPKLCNEKTGKIHTSYNQVVAVTGRLSSDKPNLQNIPIRTERGREVRKAFVPRSENHILLAADYSQIELRLIAELSKDEGMLAAFNSGEDIHKATAAKVYDVALEDVTSDQRRNAKMVNFGIIYGISAFGLSERLNIPRAEAKEIIENYFMKYPYIRDYMDSCVEEAREKGYVETIMGRRRYLRDINAKNHNVRSFAERNAINTPIQGSAADMIKIAMINLHKELTDKGFKSKMLLQVHDELVFDVLKEELATIKPIIKHHMENAIPNLNVPIEVEIGIGENWLEAH